VEYVFPPALAFLGLAITLLVADVLVQRELEQLRRRTAAEAKHVAAQLRVGVLQAFEPLQRVAKWWLVQGRPESREEWDADANLFVNDRAGLERVTWLERAGDRVWTLDPGQNTPSDGVETPRPQLRRTVETALRTGTLSVSDVFEVNGVIHVYACYPVKHGERLVGFVAGLYRVTDLIRSVLDAQLPDDYSVSVTANGRRIPAVAGSSRSVWEAEARQAGTSISNSLWLVQVAPPKTMVTAIRGSVFIGGFLISILIYACSAIALIARRRTAELTFANRRLLAEDGERQRRQEKIRKLNLDLQRRLDEFQILIDVLPIGIAISDDPECRTIRMNRSMAAILNVPLDRNISREHDASQPANYRLQLHGRDVPPEELPMQVAARTGRPVEAQELDIIREDGTVVHTLSYAAPVFDEAGRVRGVINACVDITAQRHAEEERRTFAAREGDLEQRLVRAEKYSSLALMAGGIAHDFNNLLTVIIGDASLLTFEIEPQSAAATKLGDLMAAAERAAELTARLLAFTGQIWCTTEAMDLSARVLSAESSIRGKVPPGVELQFELAENLPLIRAGFAEVQQVIDHLVENAVEALDGHPGTIAIRTGAGELSAEQIEIRYPDQHLAPGWYVALEVIDNGCGIPQEIMPRVFDPFFSTKFFGRGLGLSAVQGIVRAHGGGVLVDSLPRRGTRIEIRFPVDAASMSGRAVHV